MAQGPGGGQAGTPGAASRRPGRDLRRGLSTLHSRLDGGGRRVGRCLASRMGGAAAELLGGLRRFPGALQVVVLTLAELLLVL